jgi:hypothetical protein
VYSSTLGLSSELILEDFVYVPRAVVVMSRFPCFGDFSKILSFHYGYIVFPEQSGLTGTRHNLNILLSKVREIISQHQHNKWKTRDE